MAKNRKIKKDSNIHISNERTPKNQEVPNSYFSWNPSWNFSKCDFEHSKWSLQNSDVFQEIIPKLISFERRTWGDIISDRKHNHWIDTSKLTKEAQDRLLEIQLFNDSLFSLHLTGTLRLFGYIENGVYYIVWYDPNHEICPSPKKHT